MGCGRTLDEIANWSRWDEQQRSAVAACLPERLAGLGMTIDHQVIAYAAPVRTLSAS